MREKSPRRGRLFFCLNFQFTENLLDSTARFRYNYPVLLRLLHVLFAEKGEEDHREANIFRGRFSPGT